MVCFCRSSTSKKAKNSPPPVLYGNVAQQKNSLTLPHRSGSTAQSLMGTTSMNYNSATLNANGGIYANGATNQRPLFFDDTHEDFHSTDFGGKPSNLSTVQDGEYTLDFQNEI